MTDWIDVPELTPRHLKLKPSFSRIETFTNCERRYLFDLLFPQPSTPAQKHGHRVHAQLERLVLGQPLTSDVLPQAVEGMRAWDELEATAAGTELWIEQIRDLPFSGKIDVLAEDSAGERFVVDWKTCKNLMNAKSQYEARRYLQLHVYCLAAECNRAVLVYLPFSGGYRTVDVTFSDAELEVAYRRLERLVAAIRARWAAAGAATNDGTGGIIQPDALDLEPFSVAKAEYMFCSERWCPFWDRCLGKEPAHGEDS